MSPHSPSHHYNRQPSHQAIARGQLHLIFRLGEDSYALAIEQVRELLPLQRLKQLPEAPAWVAGILAHRGQMIPVIDLYQRCLGRPAQARTSTRLVVVNYSGQPLGLLLEQASHLQRLPPERQTANLTSGEAGYLGDLQSSQQLGLVQHIRVEGLLPADVAALLYPSTEHSISPESTPANPRGVAP